MTGARGVPDLPLGRAAGDTIIGTFTGLGLDPTFAAKLGLVTDDFVDPDALLPRLREEVANAGAVVTTPALISAWSRV